jgi:hypothetical protein
MVGMMEPAQGRGNGMPGVQLKEENQPVEEFVRWTKDLVAFVLPGSQAKEVEPLLAILELSMVIDKAADLRNDLFDNTANRTRVYHSVLNLVEKIRAHQLLLRLVQDSHLFKTRCSDLQISFAMDPTGPPRLHNNCLCLQPTTRANRWQTCSRTWPFKANSFLACLQ